MKKAILIFYSSIYLLSCGNSDNKNNDGGNGTSNKKSGKQVAEEVCDCSRKANALPVSDPNRRKAQDDCMQKGRDAWESIKDDREKAEEYNDVIGGCAEEQIQKSFGQ